MEGVLFINTVLTISQQDMVLKNQGIVVHCIDKVLKLDSSLYEEAFSVGIVGLCKAALNFNVDKGVSFSSFAFKVVKNEILFYLYGEKKYLNDLHFEDNINSKSDKEVLLIDRYVDMDAISMDEHMERISDIEKAISIILNCFSGKNRLIPLYFFSGITQFVIAKKFNLTRSSVAMKVKKVRSRLLDIDMPYKETFFVDVKDGKIEISFFLNTKNDDLISKLFDNICSDVLKKVKFTFKNSKFVLRLPIEKESFSLLADVIKEIEYIFSI